MRRWLLLELELLRVFAGRFVLTLGRLTGVDFWTLELSRRLEALVRDCVRLGAVALVEDFEEERLGCETRGGALRVCEDEGLRLMELLEERDVLERDWETLGCETRGGAGRDWETRGWELRVWDELEEERLGCEARGGGAERVFRLELELLLLWLEEELTREEEGGAERVWLVLGRLREASGLFGPERDGPASSEM
ncbi:hypothetical protein [Pelagicoccus mobilis]|uniref:Uncharacterized protein n=1 Tax=Pelagicoccus mobilis TaxID=415221 RepID=A0A934VMJ9_9BACT|nr:hypothetical protein [Pelagicoccus mobilis]MBK1878931.1 hypothetical protein [Pelagicoccus mobilis]